MDAGSCEDGSVVDVLMGPIELPVSQGNWSQTSCCTCSDQFISSTELHVFSVPRVGLGTHAHKHTPCTFICVIRHCKSDEIERGEISWLRGDKNLSRSMSRTQIAW